MMVNKGQSLVFDRVRKIVAEVLSAKEDAISMQTDVALELGADSADLMMLLVALEDEFGGSLPEEDAQRLNTVGSIVNLIVERYPSAVSAAS